MRESRPIPWLGFFRLLRIPNVFTAWSDTLMAFLVAQGAFPTTSLEIAALMLLLGATTGLYLGGMVLNDWFDFAEDQKVRAFRPLPSGQFSLRFAATLGFGLLFFGVASAALSGITWSQANPAANTLAPLLPAICLVFAILAYNGPLKRTPVGPIAMGLCRALNILLGMSLAWPVDSQTGNIAPSAMTIALGICLYITGVTWFARKEETSSPRSGLILGLTVMCLGILLLAIAPDFGGLPTGRIVGANYRWLMLLVGGVVAIRCLRAIADPQPAKVQIAIKIAILSLIWLDAAIALRVASFPEALCIALLLVPALLVGRAVYST